MREADGLIQWGSDLNDNIEAQGNDTFGTESAIRYVVWNNKARRISSGQSDEVKVMETENEILVLSINHQLQFIGLEIFLKTDEGPLEGESVYLQNDEAIDDLMMISDNSDIDEVNGFDAFCELEAEEKFNKLLLYI